MGEAVDSYSILGHGPAAIQARPNGQRQRHGPGSLRRMPDLLSQARDLYADLRLALHRGRVDQRRAAERSRSFARARPQDAIARQLATAGRIQAGLLPDTAPSFPGWDVAATLEPALETWGDFFDFIPLPGDRLALVVADVVDKGAGAALCMALTRTLLRSCAGLYPNDPGRVLETVNARILNETNTGMFVTVFYGVLDPETGTLHYANGGHNPAYLFGQNGQRTLALTGMALGAVLDTSWETRRANLSPGDTLFLYTDGAIDAQAPDGGTFGLERLLSTVQAHLGRSCAQIQAAILDEIHRFVGRAPRFDDLTLMVMART